MDVTDEPLRNPALDHAAVAEAAVWSGSKGQIINAPLYLVCTLGFWLLLPLVIGGWTWLATRMHRYEVSDQRLRERTGVLNLKTEEVELYRVKDVTVSQPFLARLVGRGNVILETSDHSTPTVHLIAIRDPSGVASLIRHYVERARTRKGVREFD